MSLSYLLFMSFRVLNTHLILIFAAYQIGTVSIHQEVFWPVPNLNLLGMQKALSYFSSESELLTEMVGHHHSDHYWPLLLLDCWPSSRSLALTVLSLNSVNQTLCTCT